MKNLKKVLALTLVFAMAFAMVVTAGASFTDADAIDPSAADAVQMLAELGVVNGRPDGSFAPKDKILRSHFSKMVYILFSGASDGGASFNTGVARFTDIANYDGGNYVGYINYMKDLSIMDGNGDGTFGPDTNISNAQVLKVVLRALGYDKNLIVPNRFVGPNWQSNVVAAAFDAGFLDNTFIATPDPSAAATREWVSTVFYKMLDTKIVNKDEEPQANTFSEARLRIYKLEGVLIGNHLYGLDGVASSASNGFKIMFAGKARVVALDITPNSTVEPTETSFLGFKGHTFVRLKANKVLGDNTTKNDIERVYGGFIANEDSRAVTIPGDTAKLTVSYDGQAERGIITFTANHEKVNYNLRAVSDVRMSKHGRNSTGDMLDLWNKIPYYPNYNRGELGSLGGNNDIVGVEYLMYTSLTDIQDAGTNKNAILDENSALAAFNASTEDLTLVFHGDDLAFIFTQIRTLVKVTSVNAGKTVVRLSSTDKAGVVSNETFRAEETKMELYEGISQGDLAYKEVKSNGTVVLKELPTIEGKVTSIVNAGLDAPGKNAYVVVDGVRYYSSKLPGNDLGAKGNVAEASSGLLNKTAKFYIESEGSQYIVGVYGGSETLADVENFAMVSSAYTSYNEGRDVYTVKVLLIKGDHNGKEAKEYGFYDVVSYKGYDTAAKVGAAYPTSTAASTELVGQVFNVEVNGSNVYLEEIDSPEIAEATSGAISLDADAKTVKIDGKTYFSAADTLVYIKAQNGDGKVVWAGYTLNNIARFGSAKVLEGTGVTGYARFSTVSGNRIARLIVIEAPTKNLPNLGVTNGQSALILAIPATAQNPTTRQYYMIMTLAVDGVVGEYMTVDEMEISYASGATSKYVTKSLNTAAFGAATLVGIELDGTTITAMTVEDAADTVVIGTAVSAYGNNVTMYAVNAANINDVNVDTAATISVKTLSSTKYYMITDDGDTVTVDVVTGPVLAPIPNEFDVIKAGTYTTVVKLDSNGDAIEMYFNVPDDADYAWN